MKINSRLWISFSVMIAVALTSISMAFAQSGGTTAIITDEDRATVLVKDEATAKKLAGAPSGCEKLSVWEDLSKCNLDKAECEKREKVANETSAEYAQMYAAEYEQCHGVRCTPAEVKAKDPKCFPKTGGSKGPKVDGGNKKGLTNNGPKVEYCANMNKVLDSVLGHTVIVNRSDVVIVKQLTVNGNVAGVECVPSYAAVKAYADRVNEVLTHVCYEEGYGNPNSKCSQAKAGADWVTEWATALAADPQSLNKQNWIIVWNMAAAAKNKLAELEANYKNLEPRVQKLEKTVYEDHKPRIEALEKAIGKTFALSFSGEVGGIFSSVSTTFTLGVRADLIVRPSMQFGHAGYVGFSGGRGWTSAVDGIPQPTTVVYTIRGGYHGILNPTDKDPSVYALRLGVVYLGAWPVEANQNISAAGPEAAFVYNYKRFNLALNFAVVNGRFSQYNRDPDLGGAVARAVYGNEWGLMPTLDLGFIF